MSKRTKWLLAGGLAVFVALVVWTVATIPEVPQDQTKVEAPKTMTYEGNTLSEEKDGRKLWELTAERIEVDVETQDVKLVNITGHFYAEDGRTVEIKADQGEFANETKDISVKGNVDIHTSDGASLKGQELRWQAKEEMLAAIGDAVAVKDDMKVTGDRIESTDGFNKIKIIGKAHLVKGGDSI
ncbi:LPS export ABC transporter protein LptC [Selenomonas sp. GACV-9]|uniref:LPS export ABC transporter periplasmic protein LptC n=1 Tax=Selenomonas sp. GACV-9 TaxID=3158782 RepID=UPI0008E33A74|nr:LPS export ABC transporter protein LptC [Selenomonas ruminantium]